MLLTLLLDGKYFFDHLLSPRPFYANGIWGSAGRYLYFIQGGFLVAMVWMLRVKRIDSTGFLLWGFPIATRRRSNFLRRSGHGAEPYV